MRRMADTLPATGLVKVRILQVNTLTQGEVIHDVKARVLPRGESRKPVMLRIRDELCPRPPQVGDRWRLTMQLGQVAGVEALKARKPDEDDEDAGADDSSPDRRS